jgi:hypothetical protein
MAVLQDKTKPTYEQLMDIIAEQQRLLAEKKRHGNEISFKVNTLVKDPTTGEMKPGSRGLSIYGLGQRPIFAYASQWLRILDKADELRAFIEANRSALAWKDQ